ncbi:hypothetical protein AVEN_74761-1 [Araneus ventricosus]|uniref:Uncharacterized protein n=1 Tax=Araneus ventricosus TaxID=182803 RepID=A0A4Y2JHF1_ARAVE|nr:hypothetical protein AVEN_74761-1 [Araneus ventricosus]
MGRQVRYVARKLLNWLRRDVRVSRNIYRHTEVEERHSFSTLTDYEVYSNISNTTQTSHDRKGHINVFRHIMTLNTYRNIEKGKEKSERCIYSNKENGFSYFEYCETSRKTAWPNDSGNLVDHDKARPCSDRLTQEKIEEFRWQLFQNPSFSPEIAPSNYPLFGPLFRLLKLCLGGAEHEVHNHNHSHPDLPRHTGNLNDGRCNRNEY